MVQKEASRGKTLSAIIQEKANPYEVDKQPHDAKKTRASTLELFQTNGFKATSGKGNEVQYKSSKRLKFIISEPSRLPDRNFKRDYKKQTSAENMIQFEPYLKDLKLYKSSTPQNNFKRVGENAVIKDNAFHYDTNDIKISKLPKLLNNNSKRYIEKLLSDGSRIRFKTNTYPNELKISESPISQDSFKELTEKPATEGNPIYTGAKPDEKFYESPMLKSRNSKNSLVEEVGISSVIHYDIGRHFKDAMNIETIVLPVHQDNRTGRVKREVAKDSNFYYDADHIPKIEKGIKILEQDPGDSGCNYNQCVEICNTIYFAIPIHLAQCYNNSCFCFPKKDLYPPVIKNFMKTHKLFGIQQTYE